MCHSWGLLRRIALRQRGGWWRIGSELRMECGGGFCMRKHGEQRGCGEVRCS